MGQALGLVVGVAGAVVGGFFGGPLGAQAGFMLGSLVGNLLTPHKSPTPADVRVQDSAYGKFIPKMWGRYRLSGNLIWAGTPHSHDPGGKGGGAGKGGNQPYVTMSFAVALCEGPVQAILRIWANGKLIYDVSNPSNWRAISGSSSMVQGWTLYPGDENQNADPTMQSQLGAGNVPAYRGLAYVVFNELNLQQWGNYMPSLSFEVVRDATPTLSVSGSVNKFGSPGIGGSSTDTIVSMSSNGDCYGWVTGIYSADNTQFAARPFLLTASGLQWQGPVMPTGLANMPADGCMSYDAPGILIGSTWYNNSGSIEHAGISPGLFLNQGGRVIRRNNRVFYTSTYGAGYYPLYISPVYTFAHSIIWASTPTFQMEVVAVTDNYVYCSTLNTDATAPGSIIKFDHDGNYLGVAIAGKGGLTTRAYVVNDSLIYFAFGNYNNTFIYRWDGVNAPVDTGLRFIGGGTGGNMFRVDAGETLYMVNNNAGSTTFYAGVIGYTGAQVSLQTIVEEVCQDAGLQSTQYSAGTLADTVIGYGNTGNASTRDILTPLMAAYFIDISDSDGQLKFIHRGATPVSTIPWDDLGADTQQESEQAQNPIKETISQEFELPAIETLSYISATTDYQTSSQREFYPSTTSNLIEAINVPIVLADNDAKVRVQTMLWEKWSKRRQFDFSTGYKYLQLEPGDTVNLQRQDGSLIPVRITKVALDGKGVVTFNSDFTVPQIYPAPGTQTYTAQGSNSIGFNAQQIDYSGPTIFVPMDLPPLRPQDATTPALYLAACGFDNTWPGCYVDLSRDDVSFTQLFTMSGASVIGQVTAVPNAFPGGDIVDESNTITVQLFNASQSLSSISYASLINGGNAALVGSELIYFRTATQIDSVTWQLTGLLRGRINTPQTGHAVGEFFVLLDPNMLGAAPINLTDIGQPLYFETYLRNMFGNTPNGPTAITPANARLAPLAPARLTAVAGAYASGAGYSTTDITLRWFRRARINYGWYDGTDVPLDWSQESYQIIIATNAGSQISQYVLSSTGVTRNGVAVSTPQPLPPFSSPVFVYTAAMITSDGLVGGTTYKATVRQIGDYGVTGRPSTVSFVR